MPAQDVERVREIYRLLRHGDPRQLLSFIAADATWEPATSTKRRRSENGDQLAERLLWRAAVHRFRISEIVDLHGRVLVTVAGRRMHYLGARGWRANRLFQLVTLRDGRLAKLEDFSTRDEALTAAGIRR